MASAAAVRVNSDLISSFRELDGRLQVFSNGLKDEKDDDEEKNNKTEEVEKRETTDRGGGLEDDIYSRMAELEVLAAVKFNKIVFCKEQFYHFLFPLSAPFMYFLDGGMWSFINRGFYGWDNLYLMAFQWFLAANFFILNIVSIVYVSSAEDYSFLYDVLLVDLLWFMRNMVVATKYAYLSKIEMKEMHTTKVSAYVHSQRTLFSAWKDPIPRRVLKNELLLAAVRTKAALQESCFSLDISVDSTRAIHDLIYDLLLTHKDPRLQENKNDDAKASSGLEILSKQADRWLESSSQVFTGDPTNLAEAGDFDSVRLLPVKLYAFHVIHQSCSLRRLRRIGHTMLSQHLRLCMWVLGLVHAIIPLAGRYILGGHKVPGPVWTAYCIMIPSFILTVFSMGSNVGFMMVGVLDFRRRHFIARSLDELLRTSLYLGSKHVRSASMKTRSQRTFLRWMRVWESNSEDELSSRSGSSGELSGGGFLIDFNDPDSLLAWWTCRQLMINFGCKFYKRIKYYTTYFAGYCGVLLLFLVLKMLMGIRRDDLYLLITVIFSINVFLTLLALMVWPGGDVNYVLQHHGTTLVDRKIKTHRKILQGSNEIIQEELKRVNAVIKTVTSIAEAVKWDNGKMKLSICGFEARDQLLSVIIAVVAGCLSIGIGQIVQNGIRM